MICFLNLCDPQVKMKAMSKRKVDRCLLFVISWESSIGYQVEMLYRSCWSSSRRPSPTSIFGHASATLGTKSIRHSAGATPPLTVLSVQTLPEPAPELVARARAGHVGEVLGVQYSTYSMYSEVAGTVSEVPTLMNALSHSYLRFV